MSPILILLALSALSGFVLGIGHFSWPAILVAGAVLAPLSTIVLQNQDFDALSGISVIVACLTINQAAYVVGTIRANDGPKDGSVEDSGSPGHGACRSADDHLVWPIGDTEAGAPDRRQQDRAQCGLGSGNLAEGTGSRRRRCVAIVPSARSGRRCPTAQASFKNALNCGAKIVSP